MPRNILIDPQRTGSGNPNIQFSGSAGNPIRLEVLSEGSVQFTGVSGSLFRISDFPPAGGTLNSLFLSGTTAITGSFVPGVADLYDLGSTTKRWLNVFAANISGSLTGSGLTAGQVVVAGTGGLLSGSNSFWWSNASSAVGIGTSTIGNGTRLTISGGGIIINDTGQYHVNSNQFGNLGASRRLNYGDILLGYNLRGQAGDDNYYTHSTHAVAGYGGVDVGYQGNIKFYSFSGATTAGASLTPNQVGLLSTSYNWLSPRATITDLFMNSSGQVGIGTSAIQASAVLQVNRAAGGNLPQIALTNSNVGGSVHWIGTGWISDGLGSTDTLNLGNNAQKSVSIISANAAVLTVVDDGTKKKAVMPQANSYIGIGTTNPTATLQVLGHTTAGTAAAAIIKEGVASQTGGLGILDVQNSSGTSLLFISGSGFTGIGTNTQNATAAGSILHVSSSLAGNASSEVVIGAQLLGTSVNLYRGYTQVFQLAGGTEAMRITAAGNIGIGTYTATARLFISGSSTASTPTAVIREGVVSPTGGAGILDVQNSAGTSIMFITGSGRVGIGTSAPQAAFHVVNGTVPNAANLYIGYVGSNNYYDANQHYYRDGSGNTRLTISSGGNVTPGSDNAQDLGSTSFRWRNVYSTALSGSLTKLTDGTSYLIAGSNVTITTGSSGAVTISSASPAGTITGTGTTNYVSKWSGTSTLSNSNIYDDGTNVGIGTATPSTKLDVNGSITIRTGATTLGSIFNNSNAVDFQAGSGASAGVRLGTSAANPMVLYTNGLERIRVDSAGNVGIGTSTPAAMLTVSGTIVTKYNTGLESYIAAGTYSAGTTGFYPVYATGGSFGSNDTVIKYGAGGNNLVVLHGSTAVLSANSAENVSIGTQSYSGRLFVSGSSTASTPTLVVQEGVTSATGGAYILDTKKSSGASVLVVSGSGKVGIGVQPLISTLQVYSGSSVLPQISAEGSSGVAGVAGYNLRLDTTDLWQLITDNNAANGFYLQYNNSSTTGRYFTVTTTGNVGIGTTSPGAKFNSYSSSNGFVGMIAGASYGAKFTSAAGTGMQIAATDPSGVSTYSPLFLQGTNISIAANSNVVSTPTIYADTNQNVGIGQTTTLTSRLLVSGSSTAATPTVVIREGVASPTGGAGTFDVQNSAGTSLLFVSGSGRVGIGSNSLVAAGLTIADVSNLNNIARLNLRNDNSDVGNRLATIGYSGNAIQLYTSAETTGTANNTLAIFQYNNAIFYTGTSATNPAERMRIDSSGNVGIGTNSTGDKLAVNGSMSVTGSLLPGADNLYDLGSTSKRWRNLYATNISGSLTGSNLAAGQVVVAGTGGVLSGSNNFWWDNTNGRVGIGTSSSLTERLNVNGNISVTNIVNAAGSIGIQPAASSNISLNTSGTGTSIVSGLYHTAPQSISVTLGTDSWIRLATVPNLCDLKLHIKINSTNTEESINVAIKGNYYNSNTKIDVDRATYSERLREVWVDQPTVNGGPKIIYIRVRSSTFSPTVTWWLYDSTTAFTTIHNDDMTASPPAAGVSLALSTSINTQQLTNANLIVSGSASNPSVGIGTNNPGARLHINAQSGAEIARFGHETSTGLVTFLYNTSTVSGYIGNGSSILTGAGSTEFVIRSEGSLLFASSGNARRMTLDTSGNVGIGTSGMNGLLNVYKTGAGNVEILSLITTYAADSSTRALTWRDPSNITGQIDTRYNGTTVDMVFGSLYNSGYNSTERMRIKGNGDVGIGTSTYTARLFVSGSSTASTPTMIVREGVVSPTGGAGVLNVQNSAGTSLLFVSGSGYVGVGSTTPGSLLTLYNSSMPELVLKNSSNYTRLSTSGNDFYIDVGQGTAGGGSTIFRRGSGTAEHVRFDSSGNVGIGTSLMADKLAVNGTVSVTGSYLNPGVDNSTSLGASNKRWSSIYGTNIYGNLLPTSMTPGSVLYINSSGAVAQDNSNLFWNDSSKSLGIGTASPNTKLSVYGGAVSANYGVFSGSLAAYASSTGALYTYWNATSNYGTIVSVADNSGNAAPMQLRVGGTLSTHIDTSGNVGIGTTTPYGSKLAVYGGTLPSGASGTSNLSFASNLSAGRLASGGGGSDVSIINTYFDSSTVELSAGTTSGYVSGIAIGARTSPANDSVTIYTRSVERARIYGTSSLMSVTASIEPGVDNTYNLGSSSKRWNSIYAVNISGSFTGSNLTAGQVVVAGTGGVLSGSSNFWWDNTNGRVGIGTSSPSYRFAIENSDSTAYSSTAQAAAMASLRNTYGSAGNTQVILAHSTANYSSVWNVGLVETGGGAYTGAYIFQNRTGVSTWAERVRIDDSGNVGIGTSTYTARLFVSGSSTASTPTMVVREGVASPTGGAGVFNVQNSAGTSLLFISGSGYVGVGITNPTTYKLDVVGQIKSRNLAAGDTTGITLGNNGSERARIQFTASDDSARFKIEVNSVNASSERLSFYAGPLGGVATNEAMIIGGNGNVGIGTGTLATSRLLVTGSGATSSTSTMHLVNSSNSSLFFVRDDGNVGIGSSSPGYTLQVGSGASVGTRTLALIDSGYGIVIKGGNGNGIVQSLGTAVPLELQAGNGNNGNYYFTSTGNVGIGTNLAGDKLAVNGSMSVTGSALPGTSNTYNLGSSAKLWSNVYATALSGSLTKLSDGTSYLIAGSNVTITTGSNGAVTVAASLPGGSVTGTGTANYVSKWNGTSTLTNSVIYDDGTNVGIGTATLTSKLHVYTTQYDGTGYPAVDINGAWLRIGDPSGGAGTFNNGQGIKFYDAGTVHYSIGVLSGNFYMSHTSDDGNKLFSPARTDTMVMTSAGRVGIGSTTPGYTLDVNGDVNLSTTKILRVGGIPVINTLGTGGSDSYINARVVRNESTVNTDGLYLGYGNSGTTTGHIRFFANGTTERMKIAADTGAVIISDLAGSVSTSTARLVVSGSSTPSTPTMVVKEGVVSPTGGAGTFDVQNSAGTSLLFVSGSTFVGIGTNTQNATAAGSILHVSSSRTGNASSEVVIGAQILGNSSNLYRGNFQFFQLANGTETMRIDSSGNVGIGTNTTNGNKLSVNGQTAITGSLLPGVDNTYDLGSTSKRWKTIYAAAGSISNVVFSPVSTGATYSTTFASGESGRLTATKTIAAATNTTFFTVSANNGASMFDVSFVVSESGFSVARKYSVAAQYGTSSSNVVTFKTVDTGPYSGYDLTVTFTKSSGAVTTCTVSHNYTASTNIAMTIDVSAISSGGAPTTVTIF